jgi:DNA-binding NarL/FixJ family response regulator
MKPYRVLLADDHAMFRQAVKKSLEEVDWISVIGDVSDGEELMEFLKTSTPDLIILDISMPKLQGLEAAEIIKHRYPDIKILLLTMHKSGEYMSRAFITGVEGYLLKDNAIEDLVSAIETIKGGGVYTSSLLGGVIREKFGLKAPKERLSSRETEILKLVANGKSSKEIAELLSISIMTVFNHRVHIKKKLQITRNADLIRFAIEKGYV